MEELISELENGNKPKVNSIDFFSFANEFIATMEQNGQTGTAQNYKCAIKASQTTCQTRHIIYIRN